PESAPPPPAAPAEPTYRMSGTIAGLDGGTVSMIAAVEGKFQKVFETAGPEFVVESVPGGNWVLVTDHVPDSGPGITSLSFSK
ncbi:MAG: hypothetical protein OSW77_14275, partial [Proteobacteria bacterium]|nr:hypothetical protein [Pseudomonadota bacterium]